MQHRNVDRARPARAASIVLIVDRKRVDDFPADHEVDPRDVHPVRRPHRDIERDRTRGNLGGIARTGLADVGLDERPERDDRVTRSKRGRKLGCSGLPRTVVGDPHVGARVAGPLVGQLVRVGAADCGVASAEVQQIEVPVKVLPEHVHPSQLVAVHDLDEVEVERELLPPVRASPLIQHGTMEVAVSGAPGMVDLNHGVGSHLAHGCEDVGGIDRERWRGGAQRKGIGVEVSPRSGGHLDAARRGEERLGTQRIDGRAVIGDVVVIRGHGELDTRRHQGRDPIAQRKLRVSARARVQVEIRGDPAGRLEIVGEGNSQGDPLLGLDVDHLFGDRPFGASGRDHPVAAGRNIDATLARHRVHLVARCADPWHRRESRIGCSAQPDDDQTPRNGPPLGVPDPEVEALGLRHDQRQRRRLRARLHVDDGLVPAAGSLQHEGVARGRQREIEATVVARALLHGDGAVRRDRGEKRPCRSRLEHA